MVGVVDSISMREAGARPDRDDDDRPNAHTSVVAT